MGSTCARSNTRQIYSLFVSERRGIEFRGGSYMMIGNQLNIHALLTSLIFFLNYLDLKKTTTMMMMMILVNNEQLEMSLLLQGNHQASIRSRSFCLRFSCLLE